MNKEKTSPKFSFRWLLIIFVLLILFNLFQNLIKQSKKDKNTLTLQAEKQAIIYQAQASFLFEEEQYDIFNGIELNINHDNLYRESDLVTGSIDMQANTRANERLKFLDKLDPSHYMKDEDILQAIYHNQISTLKATYIDDLNYGRSNLKKEKKFLEDYLSDKSIYVVENGYYQTSLDAYESFSNPKINSGFKETIIYNFSNPKAETSLKGLKFQKKSAYQVLLEIQNFRQFDSLSMKNLKLCFDNQCFYPTAYEITSNSDDKARIIFELIEGFELARTKKVDNVDLVFETANYFLIPKKASITKEGMLGVYTIIDNVVDFIPIKAFYEDDSHYYVQANSNQAYTLAQLDLIEDNNAYINYNINHPDYLMVNKLKEFTNIILNPKDYDIGDIY